ncbi:MAG: hypothetical protein PHU21_12660, partial [Elusimicrobia bacterium]|nr:hypothetical protein [Elusimicrobiota bacterium]
GLSRWVGEMAALCRPDRARRTPIGFVPTLDGLDLEGLDLPRPPLELVWQREALVRRLREDDTHGTIGLPVRRGR